MTHWAKQLDGQPKLSGEDLSRLARSTYGLDRIVNQDGSLEDDESLTRRCLSLTRSFRRR